MRTLTATLEAKQKELQGLAPVIALEVSDRPVEIPRWSWTFSSETGIASCHGASCLAADGSLQRIRIKTDTTLQLGRLTDLSGSWPGGWTTYAAGYATTAQCGIGAATDGGTVIAAYVDATLRTIYYRVSTDHGSTFGAELTLVTEALGTAIKGLSMTGGAGYVYIAWTVDAGGAEPNDVVKVQRYEVGVGWGAVAADGGHDSVVACGTVLEGSVQRIVLGGAAGLKRRDYDWGASAWQTAVWLVQTGSTAAGYTLNYPRMAVDPDGSGRYVYTWLEEWTVASAGSRYWFAMTPDRDTIGEGRGLGSNLGKGWDVIVSGSSWYAVAPHAHYTADLYEASATQKKDLGADVIAFDVEEAGNNRPGRARVWLQNADGRYATPGTDTYAMIKEGARACLGLGYRTSAGSEKVWLPPMWIDKWAHVDEGGEGYLVLELSDAWGYLDRCIARHQVTFSGLTYAEIASKLLYRVAGAGLASAGGLGLTADPFAIKPGESIGGVLRRVMNLAGVGLRFGTTAVSGDPGHWDAATVTAIAIGSGASGYSFGPAAHKVLKAEYGSRGQRYNLFEVIGVGFWDWRQDLTHAMDAGHMYLWREADWHLDDANDVQDRRDRIWYESKRGLAWGWLEGLPHVGAELYDLIAVTDSRANLTAALRRIEGIRWRYDGRKGGKWLQRLELGSQ